MKWQSGTTIEVKPLKFKDHTKDNADLEAAIYDLNDYLFLFSRKYISPAAKTTLKDVLRHFGKKISEITDEKVKTRKNEAIAQIKTIYHSLTNYQPDEDDVEAANKIYNYQLARYLKIKDSLTIEQIVEFLKENKIIYGNYYYPAAPSFKHFVNMENELINKFTKIYSF